MVKFSDGDVYKDAITCNIVLMDMAISLLADLGSMTNWLSKMSHKPSIKGGRFLFSANVARSWTDYTTWFAKMHFQKRVFCNHILDGRFHGPYHHGRFLNN